MLVNICLLIRIREGEELKTPRHASAAATRNNHLPHSRQYYYIVIYSIRILLE